MQETIAGTNWELPEDFSGTMGWLRLSFGQGTCAAQGGPKGHVERAAQHRSAPPEARCYVAHQCTVVSGQDHCIPPLNS